MTSNIRKLNLRNAGNRRNVDRMFPGYGIAQTFGNTKHDFNKDFGYPDHLLFKDYYNMYQRGGMASAGVDKTILKTWETHPVLRESEKSTTESTLDSEIRQRFSDLRVWQKLSDTDKRSLVGNYSGVILRLADGKRFAEPVDTVPGGLGGLAGLIPCWEGQLDVSRWDDDEASETYGEPEMFTFNESRVGKNTQAGHQRAFEVHPDRVILWSVDGTIHGESVLQSGFNSLIDMEKIRGAGGQGFWKNAKAAPVFNADKDLDVAAMAKNMGVAADEVADAMNDQVNDWNEGFDAALFMQGMEAKALAVTLPIPEHFFSIALQTFAASLLIPLKILVGNQTGERASTEDAAEWALTNASRRTNSVIPNIMNLINRLEQFKILPERDWFLDWDDLTEAGIMEKMERADKMATINQKMGSEPAYTVEEIREVTDFTGAAPEVREEDIEEEIDPLEDKEEGAELP